MPSPVTNANCFPHPIMLTSIASNPLGSQGPPLVCTNIVAQNLRGVEHRSQFHGNLVLKKMVRLTLMMPSCHCLLYQKGSFSAPQFQGSKIMKRKIGENPDHLAMLQHWTHSLGELFLENLIPTNTIYLVPFRRQLQTLFPAHLFIYLFIDSNSAFCVCPYKHLLKVCCELFYMEINKIKNKK